MVASGRSDYPNQINNVLAFPGVFRGLLDARASEITTDMLLRAADAIAHVVNDDELNPNFIIPSVFHPEVPKAVAAAIRGERTRRTLTPMAVRETRMLLLGAVAMFEPVNGYQIRRELVSWQVDQWAHVNPGSIYHGLVRPDGRGLPDPHRPASTAPARWRSTRSPTSGAPCSRR